MPTNNTQKIESELKDILARLTTESEAAKALTVEIKKLDDDVDALDMHLNGSQKDVDAFLETQSKELDTMIAEEQKDIEADRNEVEAEE